jgi:GNAT superfamily N-acetyltransferase
MSERPPIPLTPQLVAPGDDLFKAIAGWPFTDPFVSRLLRSDVPQRAVFGNCRVWAYREPGGTLVGFGTLDVCDDYGSFTSGRAHPYIPLLAVNPTIKSRGYGTGILWHLIDEAALLACRPSACCDLLFLDVYTTSEKAIQLYTDAGFGNLTPEPVADPLESGKTYLVMAKRVSVAPAGGA